VFLFISCFNISSSFLSTASLLIFQSTIQLILFFSSITRCCLQYAEIHGNLIFPLRFISEVCFNISRSLYAFGCTKSWLAFGNMAQDTFNAAFSYESAKFKHKRRYMTPPAVTP
jgi:hypothetical protein